MRTFKKKISPPCFHLIPSSSLIKDEYISINGGAYLRKNENVREEECKMAAFAGDL